MKMERAAEVILGGKAWDRCMVCNYRINDEDLPTGCASCIGGWRRCPAYVMAHNLIKPGPYPKNPVDLKKVLARGAANFLRGRMTESRFAREYLPPIRVEKP